MNKHETDATI